MGIIERILEKPVEALARSNKPLPSREALLLYRHILKFAQLLNWHHKDGTQWSHIIKTSTRAEFEAAKEENDPFLLAKLILTSREALENAREKVSSKQYFAAQFDFVKRIQESRTDSKP